MDRTPITPIKDAIHGYMSFSALEKLIIDSHHFQRLHFVLQNSATFTAYPNNKNSRFSHSLGVAHLAGAIFSNSLTNADADTLKRAFIDMAAFIGKQANRRGVSYKRLYLSWENLVGTEFPFHHKPLYGSAIVYDLNTCLTHEELRHYDPLFILNTFGVAIRVCGLVHDIGHLPMSHIFEDALTETEDIFERYNDWDDTVAHFSKAYAAFEKVVFSEKRYDDRDELSNLCQDLNVTIEDFENYIKWLPIHERRGLQVFDEILWQVREGHHDNDRSYIMLVFDIARHILLSSHELKTPPQEPLFACFRTIISSQLDADRLDYTLRDPVESGITDRTFDISRLVSQCVLVYDNPSCTYILCPSYKTISVIETFFHNRFLNYRFIVYHHSVVRMNAVLKEIIQHLVRFAFVFPAHSTTSILERFGLVGFAIQHDPTSATLFPSYNERIIDEAWLRELLLEVRENLKDSNGTEERNVLCLIDTFLFRKTENLVTLWKSDIDFRRTATYRGVSNLGGTFAETQKKGRYVIAEKVWESLTDAERDKIFVFFEKHDPKIYEVQKEALLVIDELGERWEVGRISPYLDALRAVAQEGLNFHVSFFGEGLKSDETFKAKTDRLKEEIFSSLSGNLNDKAASIGQPEEKD